MKQGIGSRNNFGGGSPFSLFGLGTNSSPGYNRRWKPYSVLTPERFTLSLANSTSDFLIVLDENGNLRYANPAFTRTLLEGRSAEGQNLFKLVDSPSAERARGALDATLSAI